MKWISFWGCREEMSARACSPDLILETLQAGYDVLINVWILQEQIYVGTLLPKDIIQLRFLEKYKSRLWLACRNHTAYEYFRNRGYMTFFGERNSVHFVPNGFRIIEDLKFAYGLPQEILLLHDLKGLKVPLEKYGGICSPNIEKIYKEYKKKPLMIFEEPVPEYQRSSSVESIADFFEFG